jgi:hypothetical protein
MFLLSPMSKLGSIHIQSCRVFKTVDDIQVFLSAITRQWDQFSIAPEVYDLNGSKPEPCSEEFHRQLIYPYTHASRHKVIEKAKAIQEQTPTNDQIAHVMLVSGTLEQRAEALAYCGITKESIEEIFCRHCKSYHPAEQPCLMPR